MPETADFSNLRWRSGCGAGRSTGTGTFGPTRTYSDAMAVSPSFAIPSTGGEPQKLLANPADEEVPDWSPDGTRIVYSSARDGQRDLFLAICRDRSFAGEN